MKLAIRLLCKTVPGALLVISYVGLGMLGFCDLLGDGGLQPETKR